MLNRKTVRAILITLAALTVPVLAGAEDVWRWRDAAGQLHYSNVRGRVPDSAERVQRSIGVLTGTVAAPGQKTLEGSSRRQPQERAVPGGAQQASRCVPYYCPGPGIPYIVGLNPHELADQVKQASLLDALNLRWRTGPCF
jgi:hypothetical protein